MGSEMCIRDRFCGDVCKGKGGSDKTGTGTSRCTIPDSQKCKLRGYILLRNRQQVNQLIFLKKGAKIWQI